MPELGQEGSVAQKSGVGGRLIGWLLWLIVIAGACIMVAGSYYALTNPLKLTGTSDTVSTSVRIYAEYFAIRNALIPFMLLIAALKRAKRALSSLLALTGLVQVFDGVVDYLQTDWKMFCGVLIFAAACLICAWKLRREAARSA